MLLFTFNYCGKTFKINGTYNCQKDCGSEYVIPEFDKPTVYEVVSGEDVVWNLVADTFEGHKYSYKDISEIAFSALTSKNSSYDFIYVEEGLLELADSIRSKKLVFENGVEMQEYISHWSLVLGIYKLCYLTNLYAYYMNEDKYLMFSYEDDRLSLITDNYFAEEGIWDSKDAVEAGIENLLYNDLGEE